MSTAEIAFAITVVSFLLGLMYKVISLSVTFGRITKTLETNEENDRTASASSKSKFADLFATSHRHERTLAVMEQKIAEINKTLTKMDAKLDAITETLRT